LIDWLNTIQPIQHRTSEDEVNKLLSANVFMDTK